jgi:hypothetical protein
MNGNIGPAIMMTSNFNINKLGQQEQDSSNDFDSAVDSGGNQGNI